MKANEIQIGDWIHYQIDLGKDGIYEKDIQVKSIYGNEINCEVRQYEIISGKRLCNCKPIPLTQEILEKNGMHLYNRKTNNLMEECNHSGIFEEDDDYRVELSLDYDGIIRWTINGDEYTIMPLNYVHQLQHALRLCGINHEIIL